MGIALNRMKCAAIKLPMVRRSQIAVNNLTLADVTGEEKFGVLKCALVAQLDRVSDFESEGRGFESSPARHTSKISSSQCGNDIR